jgi:hypothetical protein
MTSVRARLAAPVSARPIELARTATTHYDHTHCAIPSSGSLDDGLGYDAEDKLLFQLPAVTKRPEEGNDCVLLRVGQSKPPHEPRVHVRGCFR